MDCSLLGGGQSLEYENGFIINHDDTIPVTFGAVKPEHQLFFTEGVKIMNKAYWDKNHDLMYQLERVLYSFIVKC